MVAMLTKTGVRVEIKDGDKGTFVAMFSAFNVKDHDGDVTVPGAFEDGAKMPVSAYGHSSWEGALPVGVAKIKTTDSEAQAHGQFFLDTQTGLDTFTTVKALSSEGLGEWSYGYDATKRSFGEWPKEGDGPKDQVRFLEQLKVHEVSPVLRGAGIGTHTVSAKGGLIMATLQDILKEMDEDKYKQLFEESLRGLPVDRVIALLPTKVVAEISDRAIKQLGETSDVDEHGDTVLVDYLEFQKYLLLTSRNER